MANFKSLTRYTNGQIAENRNGEDFLVLRNPLELEPSDDDIYVTITNTYINRPDLISYTAYGDRRLWWVVLEFNNIKDPFFDLNLGQIIRLPSKPRVLEAIQNLNKV